jgi:hypothetical protein
LRLRSILAAPQAGATLDARHRRPAVRSLPVMAGKIWENSAPFGLFSAERPLRVCERKNAGISAFSSGGPDTIRTYDLPLRSRKITAYFKLNLYFGGKSGENPET